MGDRCVNVYFPDFRAICVILKRCQNLHGCAHASPPNRHIRMATQDVAALRAEVHAFASSFPMPGFDIASMTHREL